MDLFAPSRPVRSLAALFVTWKGFLLAVALGAALAPAYDTSTGLFLERMYGRNASIPLAAAQLTRWDALYSMHASVKGRVYEQEWAFGLGLPGLVGLIGAVARSLAPVLASSTPSTRAAYALEPVVAIFLAHLSHFLAVLYLHRLTMLLSGNPRLAHLSAALHILSPAGLFLSAPYNESPFACLSFLGNLLFAIGLKRKRTQLAHLAMIAAGLLFGLATAFRSNGLVSGLLFAVEAAGSLRSAAFSRSYSRRAGDMVSVAVAVLGGLCVAAGSAVPQTLAWMRYCAQEGGVSRPWCDRIVPSIYTFVQEQYWNVGFLRYWTLNQVPLFLLAAPMLAILLKSGVELLRKPQQVASMTGEPGIGDSGCNLFVRALAAGQVVVAVLAITNYHVQIITRISSGYPVWYWWVAGCLMDKKRQRLGVSMAMFMMLYGGIQGGLPAADSSSPSIPTPEASSRSDIISNHTSNEEMSSSPSTSSDNDGHPDRLLNELIALHDDLRTWLDHTGFWDVAYRRGILADVRRLQGLDAERATVLTRLREGKPADAPAAESASLVPVTAVPRAPTGPARRPVPAPKVAKKDTRYFLVKSSTMSNVIKSQQD
ncbi:hypothetical protein E4U53_002299, partial [Claviceps sorghi]